MRCNAVPMALVAVFAAVSLSAQSPAPGDASAPGKSIVNHGSKPVCIDIEFWNGSSRAVVVPAGRSVHLPPGVVAITRSSAWQMNPSASEAKVFVQGDGSSAELPHRPGKSSTVRTDPWRPEVLLPASAPAKASSAAAQKGKTVVNEGKQPVPITVTTGDGRTVRMTVPPGEAVALPAGTTRVERDTTTEAGQASRSEPVKLAGDGKTLELSSAGGSQAVVLDPNRPEVAQPGTRPAAGPGASLVTQSGKTVVNDGKATVPVNVHTADGEVRTIVVPPGQSVALPPGTTRVERDTTSADGAKTQHEPVRVVGDNNQVALTAKGGSRAAVLDPDRPEVMRPGAGEAGSADRVGMIAEQPGKTVVNLGTKPASVDVTGSDGQTQTIVVPPGQSVALPPGTTRVERDTTSQVGVKGRDEPLRIAGDGKTIELGTKGGARVAVLDPDRPEVAQSGAQAAPKGAEGREELAQQSGKTLVNYGDRPVSVEITKADGEKQVVTVPPGEAIPLPPGTTRVEREKTTGDGEKAPETRVQVTGDGKTADLPTGAGPTKSLVLNPERPGVMLPGEFAAGSAGQGSTLPELQEGKTLVNPGSKPVPVDITMADGQIVTFTIPPGQGIALPPGVVGIEAVTLSKAGAAVKDEPLRLVGDGQNQTFTSGQGIRLDAADPAHVVRTRRSAGGRLPSGEETPEGSAGVRRPPAPAPVPRPRPKPAPAPAPESPKPGPDAYDGTYRGRAGTTALTLRIREGVAEFQVDKILARGTVTADGRITANWSGVLGTMRIEYGRETREVDIPGRAAFTGRVQENTVKGELLLSTKYPGGEEETEKIPWSCSR